MPRFPSLPASALVLAACAPPSTFANPNGMAQDQAGFSVAIDGSRAIVGVPKSDTVDSNGGKALIYQRSGTSWPLDASITSSTPVFNAQFGWSIDISADRAIVGAFGDVTGTFITGAAYIFERTDGAWQQAARLAVDTIGESGYGKSVSISGDYAVVGAPLPPPPTFTGPGVAWVYHRNAGTGQWELATTLSAADALDFIEFGSSVSIDDDVIVVGAEKGVTASTVAGAAYVFRRQGSNWIQEAKLVASDPDYHDRFGAAVSVSGDRIVVGAKEDDALGDGAGAAYVFARNAVTGAWSETQKLLAEDGDDGDNFGYSVSIDDGRILIGAWLADGEAATTGAAYQYHTVGSAWELAQKLTRADGEYGDGYGASVSISGDCGVVGAVNNDVGGEPNVGSAYHYCGLAGPMPPELVIDIICCVDIPGDPIGPVVATTRIENRGADQAIGRRWIEVVPPDGTARIVAAPDAVSVAPGEVLEERHVLPGRETGGRAPRLRLRWQDANGIRTIPATAAPARQR